MTLIVAHDDGNDALHERCECGRLTVAVSAVDLVDSIEFSCPYCETRIAFFPRPRTCVCGHDIDEHTGGEGGWCRATCAPPEALPCECWTYRADRP